MTKLFRSAQIGALLILSGCASSMAQDCVHWGYYDTHYGLGLGTLYKQDVYRCLEFKE